MIDHTAEILGIHGEYVARPTIVHAPDEEPNPSPPMSDEEVLERCRRAGNADKFVRLFDCGEDICGDLSATDAALIAVMRLYTQDAGQLDRLMRQSQLSRNKWDERRPGEEGTWLAYSIRKVLALGGPTWQPRIDPRELIAHRDTETAQEAAGTAEGTDVPELVCDAVRNAWTAAGGKRRKAEVMTGKEVMSTPTPTIAWLPLLGRDGYLAQGMSHLISAASGTGKTYLLSTVMAELAERGERIVWIHEEGKIHVHLRKEIIRHVAPTFGTDDCPGEIIWMTPDEVARHDWLADDALSHQPTIIVIDTVRTVLRLEQENDNSEVTRAMRPWVKMAQNAGVTIIFVHHTRKGGGSKGEAVAGGTAMINNVDVVIELDYHGDNEMSKRRDIKAWKRIPRIGGVYQMDEEGRLSFDGGVLAGPAPRKPKLIDHIAEAMQWTEPQWGEAAFWWKRLPAEIREVSEVESVKRKLNDLAAQERVRRLERPGKTSLFAPPGTALPSDLELEAI